MKFELTNYGRERLYGAVTIAVAFSISLATFMIGAWVQKYSGLMGSIIGIISLIFFFITALLTWLIIKHTMCEKKDNYFKGTKGCDHNRVRITIISILLLFTILISIGANYFMLSQPGGDFTSGTDDYTVTGTVMDKKNGDYAFNKYLLVMELDDGTIKEVPVHEETFNDAKVGEYCTVKSRYTDVMNVLDDMFESYTLIPDNIMTILIIGSVIFVVIPGIFGLLLLYASKKNKVEQ